MNKQELLSELAKPGPVWLWVNLYEADGEYIQACKAHVIELVKKTDVPLYNVKRRENGLYVD
jgi:hypothetical protein